MKQRLLKFRSDDGTSKTGGGPRGVDVAVALTESERFRRAIWKVMREFTHVALSDLIRNGLYEIAAGYHYWRQEERDVERAAKRLRDLRKKWS